MLVQPSLRWRTHCRWAKVRNNYCLRNYTCGLAFCSWQFGMLPVFTCLLDTEHAWNRKMMPSQRNLILNRFHVNCVCVLVVKGEETSYWILIILEFASPTVFAPQKWDYDASCTGHLSDLFEGAWWGMTLQSDVTPAMPFREMSCLKLFTLVEERSFHIHNSRCIRVVLTLKNSGFWVWLKKSQHFWMILLGLEVAIVVEVGFGFMMFFMFPIAGHFQDFLRKQNHSKFIQAEYNSITQKWFKNHSKPFHHADEFKSHSKMILTWFKTIPSHKIRQIVETPYKNFISVTKKSFKSHSETNPSHKNHTKQINNHTKS